MAAQPGPLTAPGAGSTHSGSHPLGAVVAGHVAAGAAAARPATAGATAGVLAGANAAGALTPPAPAGTAAGPDPATAGPTRVRGLRSELRRQLRHRRRVRMIGLLVVTVTLLGALPLFLGVRAATRDPVFTSLDGLDLPSGTGTVVEDRSGGSRWCFLECRFRERLLRSDQPAAQTAALYERALAGAGWQRWTIPNCTGQPTQPVPGTSYTCWRRDEFTLDLWVRPPACPTADPGAAAPADPAASAPSDTTAGAGPAPPGGAACAGAMVTIKVFNAISDERNQPELYPDPDLVGETPDPVLTADPLQEATPTPS